MMVEIIRLEHAFDSVLPAERLKGRPSPALLNAARRWSDHVWAAAQAQGPRALERHEIAAGLSVARRPVFICGAHRSGTTLVRDLLDGHPALSVLPSEGTFFTNLQAHLESTPRDEHLKFLGSEWLRRLANPINRPPYWVLGRTTDDGSPYVDFARSLMAWWPVVEQALGSGISSWPLVAIALAYASCTDRFTSGQLTRWVEKTPTNERFADRLWQEYPAATIVHVVRHPLAVFASRKRLELDATTGGAEERSKEGAAMAAPGTFRDTRRLLRQLALSYRLAVEHGSGIASTRYHLVRYEELVENASGVMEALAHALEIECLPLLLRPTVNGMPASSNSCIATTAARGEILPLQDHTAIVSGTERDLVAAYVGEFAEALGYDLRAVSPWRGRLLRWTSGISSPPTSR